MAFPIDEKYIKLAEQELGLTFPPLFSAKMKIDNGGEIETNDDTWTIYPFFDKLDNKRIKRTANHIVIETKNAREWRGFPEQAIAIGDNGSGDKLILLPEETDSNRLSEIIYLWMHETGDIQTLANNIDELQAGC